MSEATQRVVFGPRLSYCANCGSLSDYCDQLPLRCCTECTHVTRVSPSTLRCADCGAAYGSSTWIDVTLPDHQWAMIQPREGGGGVLCAGCIGHRAKTLPGVVAIRAEIAFAHAHDPQYRAVQSGEGWTLQRAVRVQEDGENGGISWQDMGPVNVEAVNAPACGMCGKPAECLAVDNEPPERAIYACADCCGHGGCSNVHDADNPYCEAETGGCWRLVGIPELVNSLRDDLNALDETTASVINELRLNLAALKTESRRVLEDPWDNDKRDDLRHLLEKLEA